MRLLTSGVAGPALIWAGYKYPGTMAARAALVALGAALIYTNFGAFQATREPDVAAE